MSDQGAGQTRYQGEDRRGAVVSDDAPMGAAYSLMFALLVLGLLGLAALVSFGSDVAPFDDGSLTTQLDATGFALALVVGALCLLRWKVVGDAPAFWLGWAALTYGAVTIGVGRLLPLLLEQDSQLDVLDYLHTASRLVVLGLAVQAVRSPDVNAALRHRRVFASTVAAVAVLTVLLQVIPGFSSVVASVGDRVGDPDTLVGSVLLIASWIALALWALWAGKRRHHRLLAWFALALIGLGGVELLRAVDALASGGWTMAPAVMRVLGLLAALTGAMLELQRAYLLQGGRLYESVASERTAEARIQAEMTAAAERAHDARNALTAIEGATQTLEHYRDRLDPESRAQLSEAISAEVHRLQRLMTEDATPGAMGRFWLADAISAVITGARSRGAQIVVEVPADLVAMGRPAETAQVVQNLIEHARSRSEGPIEVRGERDGDAVLLYIEDRGPSIAESEREGLFRHSRGKNDSGDLGSISLYVSARLMREQGGDLSVEPRIGEGASFVVRMPGFSELDGDVPVQDVADESEQTFEVGQG